MRILHLLSGAAFHGAESMAAELMRQLHALGHENHLAVLDAPGAQQPLEVVAATAGSVAQAVRVPCSGAFDAAVFSALGRHLREHHIDVVHSHKYKTTFYALPLCRLQRRGLVTTYHNWITTTPALRAYAWLDRRLARFNDVAVGVSTPVMQTLATCVPAARRRQIDNGIDTDVFTPAPDRAAHRTALGLRTEGAVIGCVGRLSSEKGVDRLIDVLGSLPAEWPWTALIVGDGDQRDALQARAQALGIAPRVQFLGHRRDVAALYRAMDLYVQPSHVEAFPMALLEALASGCTVVATEVGEVRRMLDDGRVGHLVPGEHTKGWREAIEQVLRDPAAAQQRALQGRQRVVERYSSRAMAQAYLGAYGAAVAARAGSA